MFEALKAKMVVGYCSMLTGVSATEPELLPGVSTVKTNLNTAQMVGGVIDFICEIAKYVGVVLVATGVFMVIMAYKDDNAEQQSRAIRLAVVGAVLVGLKAMLKTFGIIG